MIVSSIISVSSDWSLPYLRLLSSLSFRTFSGLIKLWTCRFLKTLLILIRIFQSLLILKRLENCVCPLFCKFGFSSKSQLIGTRDLALPIVSYRVQSDGFDSDIVWSVPVRHLRVWLTISKRGREASFYLIHGVAIII